jgi:SAM-dependent methyltransferase
MRGKYDRTVSEERAEPTGGEPPATIRIAMRTASGLIARYPASWKLLRGPMRGIFDRMAGHWHESRGVDDARLAPLTAALERIEPPPPRVLELGTGTGAGAAVAARAFPAAQIVANDLAPAMIEAAGRHLDPELAARIRFEVGDASSLAYEDGSFDLVMQLNVPVFFGEVARVLAPGGHVAIVATLGERTPIYTPHDSLTSRFAKAGIERVDSGSAGRGDWWIGRRAG